MKRLLEPHRGSKICHPLGSLIRGTSTVGVPEHYQEAGQGDSISLDLPLTQPTRNQQLSFLGKATHRLSPNFLGSMESDMKFGLGVGKGRISNTYVCIPFLYQGGKDN